MNRPAHLLLFIALSVSVSPGTSPCAAQATADAATRPTDLLSQPDFFPIGVWLQSPANANKYKEIGVNLYVGLWAGPTAVQLATLHAAKMHVICEQNTAGLVRKDQEVIVGWLQGDEPDNAQPLKAGGYGPPVPAAQVIARYEKMKRLDPAHAVFLNLGQGIAWDGWIGRGVRTNHPEDYRQYVKGCDIASFDIYPATHTAPAIAGNLWYVGKGVRRLVDWTDRSRPVWCCIEAAGNENVTPTPAQLRTEVWMALTSGATGIVYFCHQFKPRFIEAGLLANPQLSAGVGQINAAVSRLAPVLHSPTLEGVVDAKSSDSKVSIDTLCKRQGETTYVFAVAMRDSPAEVSFIVAGIPGASAVQVIDESRTLEAVDGRFADHFDGYAVHLYRLTPRR